MPLDLAFTRQALNLTPGENRPLTGLSIDTRTLQPGELFAAIRGPRFDGHHYLPQAVEAGCQALLVDTPPREDPGCPVLVVPDVTAAMTTLAGQWRRQVNPKVIAVTGSSGKTTVKEMLTLCLNQHFDHVHATRGNLNNHYGVPLTLLSMPDTCQVLVVEMGMSALGEIAHLTRIAQPDIGIVTNVLAAHLAAFASLEEIAQAKGELLAGLKPEGMAILHGAQWSTPILQRWAGPRRQTTFSRGQKGTDLQAHALLSAADGLRFTLRWPDGQQQPLHLACQGDHMIDNALATAAAARHVGVTLEEIGRGLARFSPSAGRGAILTAKGGWLVVDDCYNANPGSVTAAIHTLATTPGTGRRVAILGDMLELGNQAERLHRELAEPLNQAGISHLFTAGPLMKQLFAACHNRSNLIADHRDDPAAWLGVIPPLLEPGDRVLVKGSRGMHMERIVSDLISYAL